ncbi:MAG: hypothetical protein QXF28_05925 [Nitrososphaerota archaeon]
MMEEYFIDLGEKKPGCTENPVIRLTQMLLRVEEGKGVLKVASDEREIPLKILEMLADKRNLKLQVLEKNGTKVIVLYSK